MRWSTVLSLSFQLVFPPFFILTAFSNLDVIKGNLKQMVLGYVLNLAIRHHRLFR